MKDESLQRFVLERGIQKSTAKEYYYVLNKYSIFCKKSLKDLLIEADEEELEGTRWKDRKLKKRLLEYRLYLYNTENLMDSSVKSYITKIKTFYTHFEIEVGDLQKYTSKAVRKARPLTTEDIPTPKMVKEAIDIATNKGFKACIHFMSATGVAKVDALDLKVADFIRACEGYFNAYSLTDILNELSISEDVIGKFYIKRRKTGKWHHTYCTPEAINAVSKYLLGRKDLSFDKALFKCSVPTFYRQFKDINLAMGLGKDENGKWWFRGHKLRKFHSKQLKDGVDGMSVEDIDALQGRSHDETHEAYHVVDPALLKKKYMMHMNKLTLFSEVEYKSVESEEFKQLQKDNTEYKKKIDEQNNTIREQNEKIDEIKENQKEMKEMLGIIE